MEELFAVLGNELRLAAVRQIRRSPGIKHREILDALDLPRSKAGNLTKALEPLESAGVLRRIEGGYTVVDSDALGRLLAAAADLNIAAKQILLAKAREEIPAAEQLAREIREEA